MVNTIKARLGELEEQVGGQVVNLTGGLVDTEGRLVLLERAG
jgi:hypothetical protein